MSQSVTEVRRRSPSEKSVGKVRRKSPSDKGSVHDCFIVYGGVMKCAITGMVQRVL